MKTAVITLCGDNDNESFKELFRHTHPRMKSYADKIGADFHILKGKDKYGHLMYRKLDLKNYLSTYDRILYVDGDIIIENNSPNIFNIVPEDSIGMYNEMGQHLIHLIKTYINLYNEKLKKHFMKPILDINSYNYKTYYNAGVIVFSKGHEEFFTPPVEEIHTLLLEQTYFNLIINQKNIKMFEIGYKFNDMKWSRHTDSYFIHLTGSKHKSAELMNFSRYKKRGDIKVKKIEGVRPENVRFKWMYNRHLK